MRHCKSGSNRTCFARVNGGDQAGDRAPVFRRGKVIINRDGKRESFSFYPFEQDPFGPDVPHGDAYVLGVVLAPLQEGVAGLLGIESETGVLAIRVVEKGPAAEAGLHVHDLILEVGDEPVKGVSDLQKRIRESKGEPVAITVRRGVSETLQIGVTPKPARDVSFGPIANQPMLEGLYRYWRPGTVAPIQDDVPRIHRSGSDHRESRAGTRCRDSGT